MWRGEEIEKIFANLTIILDIICFDQSIWVQLFFLKRDEKLFYSENIKRIFSQKNNKSFCPLLFLLLLNEEMKTTIQIKNKK